MRERIPFWIRERIGYYAQKIHTVLGSWRFTWFLVRFSWWLTEPETTGLRAAINDILRSADSRYRASLGAMSRPTPPKEEEG